MKVKGSKKEYVPKEKVAVGETFEPTGEVIEKGFNAEWGGHEFTESEISQLLAGEEINITTDKGKDFTGMLAKNEYKGVEYWGFTPREKKKVAVGETFEPTGEVIEKGFNAEWGGHEFTESEISQLLAGEEIVIISGNGKPIVGILTKQAYKDHEYWGFTRGIPNTFSGHVFTTDEKYAMYNGEEIELSDLWSKKKETFYTAWLSWDPVSSEIIMDFKDEDEEEDEPEEDLEGNEDEE